MNAALDGYPALLNDIKTRIRTAQTQAALAVNQELLCLYWQVGCLIDSRQKEAGWGASVIPHLARDLAHELPAIKGFSERTLGRMIRFFREYPTLGDAISIRARRDLPRAVAKMGAPADEPKVPQPVAKATGSGADHVLPQLWSLPWGHHFVLIEKVKDRDVRAWYVENAVSQGWSRDVLAAMVKSQAHARQGGAVTNFTEQLPPPQSDLARQALKDPYVFDFLTLDAPFRERELEAGLLMHLESFLLELGVGFAFVGRQHRVTLGEDDFYLDLLFYHLKLRCFVVVELKVGAFKAEHAGKMNLYLNLVDDTLRHPEDHPTIGLILCQDKKQILAEYALRGLDKPIGVSEYELTRALPSEFESALPTIDAIEAELAGDKAEGHGEDAS